MASGHGRLRALAGTLALCLAIAAPVAAQESPRFAHLSVDDGLSQSSVQHIVQDRRGLMWFGTQEGLNRYDGYRFTVHRAREQDGFLRDHDITAMVEDAAGDLWVGTSRGLYRYALDTGRFDTCASPVTHLAIVDLISGGDGRIFFAASDGSVWVLDRGDAERRARRLNDGPFAPLVGVTALAPAGGSAIWAAANGRLFRVDVGATGSAGRLDEAIRDVGSVAVLANDRDGNLWIGRPDADLLRYRRGGVVDRFPQAPRAPLAILAGRGGDIWIGARGGGLSRLDPRTGSIAVYRHDPDNPASLSSDNVASIFEDAAGSLWIGSWNGGVDRFDPHAQAFRTFRRRPRAPDSLPANDVTAVTEAPGGPLWLASRSGRVMRGDPRTARFESVAAFPAKGRVSAIDWWEERLLVGTLGGLVTVDASGREVPLDPALQAHGLGTRRISALRGGDAGAWIASGREVVRVVRASPVAVERLALPISGPVSALSIPRDARLWIGTEAGEVLRVDWTGAATPATVRTLALDPTDRAALHDRGFIAALHEDGLGRVWVGTRRGLGRIDLSSRQISWMGEREGLPSTNISGIAADADGRLWVGHNRGLTRIDPASGAMTHFGERDGAQGKGYAEGAWAAGASGLLYFAGEGVTAFDPRHVRVSPHAPRIVFTALEVLHRVVVPRWLDPDSPLERTIDAQADGTSEVTLGSDATVFSVEMAPLHYVDPSSNRLMYRLEGFDPEWIETGAHNRVATYTNLAPGRYVLRARAATKNGLWSEQDATLALRILPPWWRTRAAMVLWLALAAGAVALMAAAVRRRARVRLALQEREALRRDSLTDPLTGLYNRRFLTTYLQHEVPRVLREYRVRGAAAAESGDDLLLLVVDVDHFKSINDRHSHGVGDRVLAGIAATLEEQIRDSDLAVRWGGDEFLVVTRSFRRASAADYAERLRAAVAALGQTLAAESGPACTVSIGFAAFPFVPHEPDALTWEQTLELADLALRLTKDRRRNSYTGVRAGHGVSAAAVLEFLASADAPIPPGIAVVMPGESASET